MIEMLVVLGIIMIIFGLMIASTTSIRRQTKQSRARADIARLEIAIEAYRNDAGLYPAPAATNTALMNKLNNSAAHPAASWPNWFGPYLELSSQETDGGGNFIDPWQRPY